MWNDCGAAGGCGGAIRNDSLLTLWVGTRTGINTMARGVQRSARADVGYVLLAVSLPDLWCFVVSHGPYTLLWYHTVQFCRIVYIAVVVPYSAVLSYHIGAVVPHCAVLSYHIGAVVPHYIGLSYHVGLYIAVVPHCGAVLSYHEGLYIAMVPHCGAVLSYH